MPDLTELQQAILHTKRNNPDASHKGVAKRVGCSPSYVSQVLSEHRGWELDQMNGDPATAEDIDREYKPPSRDKSPDGEEVFKIIIALILVFLALRYFGNVGAF